MLYGKLLVPCEHDGQVYDGVAVEQGVEANVFYDNTTDQRLANFPGSTVPPETGFVISAENTSSFSIGEKVPNTFLVIGAA